MYVCVCCPVLRGTGELHRPRGGGGGVWAQSFGKGRMSCRNVMWTKTKGVPVRGKAAVGGPGSCLRMRVCSFGHAYCNGRSALLPRALHFGRWLLHSVSTVGHLRTRPYRRARVRAYHVRVWACVLCGAVSGYRWWVQRICRASAGPFYFFCRMLQGQSDLGVPCV